MGALSVPTEHGLTYVLGLRFPCVLLCLHTRFPPTHRSSLYRSSLVGTVICVRQLFGFGVSFGDHRMTFHFSHCMYPRDGRGETLPSRLPVVPVSCIDYYS